MDPILLEKLTEALENLGWDKDQSRNMLLEINLLILKHGYEIMLQPQALTSSATNTTTGLVPPWATPTEKGIFCIGCKAVYPDLESYEKHLIPTEGKCDGGKPEPSEPLYDSYD